jgi:MoaA/NifB/PqqE/SkfB family radical SAM enzyme
MLAKFQIPNLELVTNATLLSPDKAEAIIQHGVTNLLFSLDTPDKETYEYIRRGARFEKVVNNIRWLKSRKIELRSKTPNLTLIAVLMRRNLDQMDALVDLAEELGVTHMDLRHLEVYDGLGMEGEQLGPETQSWSDPILNCIRDKALAKGISLITPDNYGNPYILSTRTSLLRQSLAFLLRWSIGFKNALNHPPQAFSKLINKLTCTLKRIFLPGLTAESMYCAMPFNHVFMGMDGRVMACPHIDDLRNPTPSDSPQKLIDVFLGDKFHHLREGSISGHPPQKCLQCPHCRLYAQNRESQDSK